MTIMSKDKELRDTFQSDGNITDILLNIHYTCSFF